MPLARVGGGFGPGAVWLILVIGLLRYTIGMEGEQGQDTKVKPPMFSGERTDYTQWMIQFTVWVALYLQECASLLEGEDPEPATDADLLTAEPATPELDLAAARSTHVRWTARNRKLLPPAADSRAAAVKRVPQADDQLIGLRPYLRDIHRLYQETEGLKHASASYMSKQTDINAKMRAILIDWLVWRCTASLSWSRRPSSLHLTVSLIDRFLEREQIPRNKLQLVGVTAMFVACKYEEVFPPACSDFVFVSDKLYSREEILRMEGLILSTLGFELTSPSAFVFIRRFAKVAGIASTAPRSTTELLASYLLELTLQEDRMRVYLPSLLCAAAIWPTRTLTRTRTLTCL